jgi:DNA-binding IclR family transcriptional regulator
LNRVKRDGYASSHDELSKDLWGLSVPLFAGREVKASIGVVVPSSRSALLQDLAKVMIRASSQISKALHL